MPEETPSIRVRVRVHGRVQGVGFRWWTAEVARGLGLAGTVRNLRDGTVEVEARGSAEAIQTLERELARGPSSARVHAVERLTPGSGSLPQGFRIVP